MRCARGLLHRAVLHGIVVLPLLSGCTLLNPHVTGNEDLRLTQGTSEIRFYGDLPRAIDYADSLRHSYFDAVGEQSLARNGGAVALVALSAAALSAAITQPEVDTLVANLAITGAGIAGTGMLLTSSDRQRVYLSGSQAVGCAILSMRPFLITEADYKAFKEAADRQPGEIVRLETDATALQSLVARFPSDALAPEAQGALATAQALLTRAQTASASTDNAVLQIETAGRTLQTAVDTIRDKVSVEITKTEPDLQSILAVASGLGGLQKQLTPAIPTKAPATEATLQPQSLHDEESPLRLPLDTMAADSQRLAEDLGRVEAILSRIGPSTDAAKLLSVCKPDTLSTEYTVDPAAIQFQAGAAAVQPVSLHGGQPPYAIALLEEPADGLSVRQLPPLGPTASVSFNGKAAPGTYHLWVNANNGQARIVPIIVIGTPAAQVGGAHTPAQAQAGTEPAITESDRKAIQTVLCVPSDGTFGQDTRFAIGEFQSLEGNQRSGLLTAAQIDTLLHLSPCPAQYRSYVERRFLDTADKVKQLQKALGIEPQSGVLDTATRDKITEYQKSHAFSPQDGAAHLELITSLKLAEG
jgi:hypothetical protein